MPDQIRYYLKETTNQILVSGSSTVAGMNALLTSSKDPNTNFAHGFAPTRRHLDLPERRIFVRGQRGVAGHLLPAKNVGGLFWR